MARYAGGGAPCSPAPSGLAWKARLSQRQFLSAGDVWQRLETLLVVSAGGGVWGGQTTAPTPGPPGRWSSTRAHQPLEGSERKQSSEPPALAGRPRTNICFSKWLGCSSWRLGDSSSLRKPLRFRAGEAATRKAASALRPARGKAGLRAAEGVAVTAALWPYCAPGFIRTITTSFTTAPRGVGLSHFAEKKTPAQRR